LVNSGEIINPSRSLPFALLTATLVVAVFYILIQITCIGTLPELAGSEKPVGDAATRMVGNVGGQLIAAGAFISILGTLNVLMFSGSRLPYAFSCEDQFPAVFSHVHPVYRTPTVSLLTVAVIAAIVSLMWSFITALTIAAIIRVTVYLLVCASLIMLRKKMPGQTGHYRIRAGNAMALAGILLCAWLLSSAKWNELLDVSIFLAVGIVLFLFQLKYGRKILQ
jgi:amino acid transporter